jgi:DNA-binding CsgD family transcriptional regulator
MNWKNYVEKKNAKTFVIPPGWDSRDEIANQLECSPERVDDHLRPALKSGEVTKQVFRVWDEVLKKIVNIVAYQQAAKAVPVAPDIAAMLKLKASGKTNAEIGAAIGKSVGAVRGLLRRHG